MNLNSENKDLLIAALNKNQVAFAQVSKFAEALMSGSLKFRLDESGKKFVFEYMNKKIYVELNTLKISGLEYLNNLKISDIQLFKEQLDDEIEARIAGDEELDEAKADKEHTHEISDVVNLQATLNDKADSSHTHAISDITNLQTTLDSKTPLRTYNTVQNVLNNWSNIPDGSFIIANNGKENYDATYIFKQGNVRALMITFNKVPKNYIWVRAICNNTTDANPSAYSSIPFRKIPVLTTDDNLEISGTITSPTITNLENLISNKADESMLTALAARVVIVETDKADVNHNHDTQYSAINHNHDTQYSAINHNHDSSYINRNEIATPTNLSKGIITSLTENTFNVYLDYAHINTNDNTAIDVKIAKNGVNDITMRIISPSDVESDFRINDSEYIEITSEYSLSIAFTMSLSDFINETGTWTLSIVYDPTNIQQIATFVVNYYTVKQANVNDSNKFLTQSDIINLMYPVGSIYTSMNFINPEQIFLGTSWTQIKDRFLYCADDSGTTGGSKKILLNQLPAHKHSYKFSLWTDKADISFVSYDGIMTHSATRGANSGDNDNTGTSYLNDVTNVQGGGEDYMPPYMTVYAWFRNA